MDGLRNVDLEAVARWGAVSSVLSWVGSASMICTCWCGHRLARPRHC